jgi:hypothetical protein
MRAWRSIEKGYIIQSDALGDWERVPRWKTRSSRRIIRRIEPAIHRSIPLRFLTYRPVDYPTRNQTNPNSALLVLEKMGVHKKCITLIQDFRLFDDLIINHQQIFELHFA